MIESLIIGLCIVSVIVELILAFSLGFPKFLTRNNPKLAKVKLRHLLEIHIIISFGFSLLLSWGICRAFDMTGLVSGCAALSSTILTFPVYKMAGKWDKWDEAGKPVFWKKSVCTQKS